MTLLCFVLGEVHCSGAIGVFFFYHRACEGMGFPAGSVVKNPPWVKKIPCRRKWQLTPAFLPGKSHEQKSLKGYSPWDGKRVGYGLTTKQQQQQYKGVYRGFKPEISLYSKQHRVDTDIDRQDQSHQIKFNLCSLCFYKTFSTFNG